MIIVSKPKISCNIVWTLKKDIAEGCSQANPFGSSLSLFVFDSSQAQPVCASVSNYFDSSKTNNFQSFNPILLIFLKQALLTILKQILCVTQLSAFDYL